MVLLRGSNMQVLYVVTCRGALELFTQDFVL
jgi:hypothetical protein